jgi:hypothetical protein
METNPYESPTGDNSGNAAGCRIALLRTAAIGLWLVSVLWAVSGALVAASSIGRSDFAESPIRFWAVLVCGFISPAAFVGLIGFSLWYRSFRFAVYGFVLLVATSVFFVLSAYFRSLISKHVDQRRTGDQISTENKYVADSGKR